MFACWPSLHSYTVRVMIIMKMLMMMMRCIKQRIYKMCIIASKMWKREPINCIEIKRNLHLMRDFENLLSAHTHIRSTRNTTKWKYNMNFWRRYTISQFGNIHGLIITNIVFWIYVFMGIAPPTVWSVATDLKWNESKRMKTATAEQKKTEEKIKNE